MLKLIIVIIGLIINKIFNVKLIIFKIKDRIKYLVLKMCRCEIMVSCLIELIKN